MCFLLGGKGKLLQAEEEIAREKNTRQERSKQDSGVSGVQCKAKEW